MNAGDRDQRVTLQSITRTNNAMNEPEESWSNIGKRWAKVEGQGGKELQRAQQTTPMATHLVSLPADSKTKTLTTDNRILWESPGGSKELGIINVDLTEYRNGVVQCLCEASA